MNDQSKESFRVGMKSIFASRQEPVPPLPVELLEAYRLGSLTPEEEARVQQHLLRSPESVQLLVWLERPEEHDPDASGTVSAAELEEAWSDFQAGLRAREAGSRTRRFRRRSLALAASMGLTVLTALGWLVHSRLLLERMAELEAGSGAGTVMSADVAVLSLERPTRGSGAVPQEVRVPPGAESFILAVDVSRHRDISEFSVRLVEESGEKVVTIRDARPDDLGYLILLLSRRALPGRGYRLEILDAAASERAILETVRLRMHPE